MKRLRAVRLVNWYHFEDETFPIEGSCLLLGDNGCGKSTVLDAIQWALVADMTQVRFNKAANEQSQRTLHSYVRHKLGSEDEARPGHLRYGRGACTSFVALELDDDRDATARFTCGVAMETSEADTSVPRWHFVLPGVGVADAPFVVDDHVTTVRAFRTEVRERWPRARLFPDAGTYRDEVRHRLGALPQTFHRLLVKALSFKPLGQVRDFVFHYLLDPKPVDTAALQANVENYKRLEANAADAERRLAALDGVCGAGEKLVAERRTLEGLRYVALRAAIDVAGDRAAACAVAHAAAVAARTAAERALAEQDELGRITAREHTRVLAELAQAPAFREVQALEREQADVAQQLAEAEEADRRARTLLAGQLRALDRLASDDARDVRRARPDLLGDDPLVGATEAPAVLDRLRGTLDSRGALGGRDLATWVQRLGAAADAVRAARFTLDAETRAARAEGDALRDERAALERGRPRYPEAVVATLAALAGRLRGADLRPLCERIEVPAERWRAAVEGVLADHRFDVLLTAAELARAVRVYGPGAGAQVGLVDLERVRAAAPRRVDRALAAEVTTDDLDARALVDHLLGDVVCVEDVSLIERHVRAVTDDVLIREGAVLRRPSPDVLGRHYVGDAARARRLAEIDARLAELSVRLVAAAPLAAWLAETERELQRAGREVGLLEELVERADRVPRLTKRAAELSRALARVDRRSLEALERERARLEDERHAVEVAAREAAAAVARHEVEASRLTLDHDAALAARDEARLALDQAFADAEPVRRAAGEERYAAERGVRGPAEIADVFDRQQRNYASRVAGAQQRLFAAKYEYVSAFGFAGDVEGDGYADFDAERTSWRDSRLPTYRERIASAKEMALQQLTEDIIFRLREHLLDVRKQIDELNRALRDVPFGSERYQFTIDVEPDRRAFHDLILAAGHFEKDSLFGNAALGSGELRGTLQDLFDRLLQSEAGAVKTELEARADYREYFRYDLKIHHADGTTSLYDKVAGDKSGGETQTPYYIAILASMHRVYRAHASDGRPTCGIVLFDEVFSKMDEDRIRATLRFARGLDLQLVLATPKERCELVAPWVETSLYVHKDAATGVPQVLDFTKELARGDAA